MVVQLNKPEDNAMYTTFHTLTRQRGAATLVVAIILLLGMTMTTFFGARVGVTEQRIAANDVRAKQAMAVAEALVENGIAYLENNKAFINPANDPWTWTWTAANPWNGTYWLHSDHGGVQWTNCTGSTALPCGDGTVSKFTNANRPTGSVGWVRYGPVPNQTPVDNTYATQVFYVTANYGTSSFFGNIRIHPYPAIHIIADVKPATTGGQVDPLAGSAQLKQIVQSFPFAKISAENTVVSLGAMGLSGSYKIWGNPTGLRTEVVLSTASSTVPTASNWIVINKQPPADYESDDNDRWRQVSIELLGDDLDGVTTNCASAPHINNLCTGPASRSGHTIDIYIGKGAGFSTGQFPTLTSGFFSNISIGKPAGFSTIPSAPATLESITLGVRARIPQSNEGITWGPLIGSTGGTDGLGGYLNGSEPPGSTRNWANYHYTWTKNPATNLAWTVTEVSKLVVRLKGTSTGGGKLNIEVSEVWAWFNGYKVQYNVPTLTGYNTVEETGFPLSVRSRAAITGSGSYDTCRNWAATNVPVVKTAPYTDWYPGGGNPCSRSAPTPDGSSVTESLSNSATGMKWDIVSNDLTLPEDIFKLVFGKPKEQYREIKSQAVVLADCSSLTSGSSGLFWITGNCNPGSGTFGSATRPIIIIVEGDIAMNGNTKIYGLLYAFSVPGTAGGRVQLVGTVTIIGAFVSDHEVDLGSGGFNMVFSRSVLSHLGTTSASFAKVPGGWMDQL